jgi:glycosyltransferase involved in cell wall biosynthesis
LFMTPLVSILIPAFNAEEWIADSIKSALAQTWARKEIIVLDDGSTDQTLAVARKFASNGVSVVTQANQGAAATRNNLFALSQGDYIQWLDADDLLSPDKIERQLKALEVCRSGEWTLLSAGWGYFHYRVNKAQFRPTALWCDLSPTEWLLRKMEQNLHMQTATWLVSRALTKSAGPWNTELMGDDDGEYFCRVIMKSDAIRFVPEAKVFYRRSGYDRLSYIGKSGRRMEAQYLSMTLNVDYIRSVEDSTRSRAACIKYLQGWSATFYPERLDLVERLKPLVESLGGRLEMPRFSWKYTWIERVCGSDLARRAQILAPRVKASLIRSVDKTLFILNQRSRNL